MAEPAKSEIGDPGPSEQQLTQAAIARFFTPGNITADAQLIATALRERWPTAHPGLMAYLRQKCERHAVKARSTRKLHTMMNVILRMEAQNQADAIAQTQSRGESERLTEVQRTLGLIKETIAQASTDGEFFDRLHDEPGTGSPDAAGARKPRRARNGRERRAVEIVSAPARSKSGNRAANPPAGS